MSKTNCFLPSSGFVLNLRVRMVNSLMANVTQGGPGRWDDAPDSRPSRGG